MIEAKCISKNRDNKGAIVSYTLQDVYGRTRVYTETELRERMQAEKVGNRIIVRNLQINKAGRIVDKAESDITPTGQELFDNCIKELSNRRRILIHEKKNTDFVHQLAMKLLNDDTTKMCVVSAKEEETIVGTYFDNYVRKRGKLSLFIDYIENNNITEPCVFICRDINEKNIGRVLGSCLWEHFNFVSPTSYPNNLYLILAGNKYDEDWYDECVHGRMKVITV